tara:strand:- start:7079 stop:7846 length:768 start_codon:yes stop_codon:yes gene_type:complete
MWVHNLDPVLLSLFGLEIRWYGLVYVIGFLLGLWFLQRYRREVNMSSDDVYDFIFYLMLGVVLGSRIFHILFWEPTYYFGDPIKILYFWQGGMAFHGGLVGAIAVTYYYCRRKNVSFLKLADVISIPAVLALALGRIANFINAELYGPVSDIVWCVDFGDGECRHPYQLYAAAKRFFVAGVLVWIAHKKKWKDGFIFWVMVLLLGFGRFFLDFYREDSLYYFFSLGQWMSLAMVVVAGLILFKNYPKNLRKLFKQ